MAAFFSTVGLTFMAAFTFVAHVGRWMLGRASTPPPRTERVLGGREEKAAALRAYLTERGVVGARAEAAMVEATHDAKRLAIEALTVGGAEGARTCYQTELAKLTASGTTELDAVYAALSAAGLPDADLRWLDLRLDATIIARQEPTAP